MFEVEVCRAVATHDGFQSRPAGMGVLIACTVWTFSPSVFSFGINVMAVKKHPVEVGNISPDCSGIFHPAVASIGFGKSEGGGDAQNRFDLVRRRSAILLHERVSQREAQAQEPPIFRFG